MAKIIIIGGGVSGLSAGTYSQLLGNNATIYEKHTIAGGNLTGWQRHGYHIDNCIHWLTGTNPSTKTYKMWQDLGAINTEEIYQGETLYTAEFNGKSLSLYSDLSKTQKELLLCSPQDKREIISLINAVQTVEKLCEIGGENHNEGITPWELLKNSPLLLKYYSLSTADLASRFSHPAIRFFIRSLLGEDFGSLAFLLVLATFCGRNGGIPAGGSLKMAERMSKRFTSLGGTLKNGCSVTKINLDGKKASSVTLSDGTVDTADYFIITPDPQSVFGSILDAPLPKELAKLYSSDLQKFSSYHCAFSCKIPTDGIPFHGDLIFPIPKKHAEVLKTDRIILREFSHEKSFAPNGETVIQSLCFCDEKTAREFIDLRRKDKISYNKLKKEIADRYFEIISEKFPQLKSSLTLIDVWTPASYKRFTASPIGSYMSFILPSKTLPRRINNRISGLDNVILATQWQQSPGGLPTAADGGRLAAETVSKLSKQP